MLPEFSGYLNRFMLRDEKGRLFTDMIEVCIIEIPKLPKEDDGTAAWPFLKCFKCNSVEEADMLAKNYPQVCGIVRELRRINIGYEVKAFFDDLIKERRDRRGREEYVHQQAFAEGITKGEAEREGLRQEIERLRRENERLRKNV
jgi:hypothetical protein